MKTTLKRLTKWADTIEKLDRQMDLFCAIFGATEDRSELIKVINLTQDAYSRGVAELVGDTGDWLAWYRLKNDMGQRKLECRIDDTTYRVDSVAVLAEVIEHWKRAEAGE